MIYYSFENLKKICGFLEMSAKQNKQLIMNDIYNLEIENNTEPFTLESITTIDEHYKFMWKQKNKYWCVDIRNLKKMFETSTIMPWILDYNIYSRGLQVDEEDMKDFDMKNIPGLFDFVNDVTDSIETSHIVTSFKTWLMFEIDELMNSDAYVNVDTLIECEDLVYKVYTTLYNISIQLLSETLRTLDMECYEMFNEHVLYSYQLYSSFMQDNQENLKLLLMLFKKFKRLCPESYKNIMHIFFFEFESN